MRIVPSLLIALVLIFGVSAATVGTASADHHEAAERDAKKKAVEGKKKADAEGAEAKEKGEAEARKEAQKAKVEAAKAERKAKAEAAKAARKERLLKQEEKRHASQEKEIEARRTRVNHIYKRQIENVDAAAAKEKARHEKRVEQIKSQ